MSHCSRTDAKFGAVADRLRAQITGGEWAPGLRLPTWDALCARFGVRRPTLMRALSILKDEGFVEADSTRATLVSARPPHLHCYTLLFPSSPARRGAGGWNLFWDALAAQAARNAGGAAQITARFDVTAHPDCEAYAEALADMRLRRVAGVLVVRGGDLAGLAPMPGGAPAVHINSSGSAGNAPSVWLDWRAFHEKAAEALLSQGRRKIAVIAECAADARECAAALARHGAAPPEKWTLAVPGIAPEHARNIARLLVAKGSRDIPDAVLVTDDNLVADVAQGILDEGRAIPRDVMALGHCNWPSPSPAPAPVARLGFSAGRVLDAAAMGAGLMWYALSRCGRVRRPRNA